MGSTEVPGTRRGGLPSLCVLLLVLAAGPAEAQVARRPAGAERGFITFDAVVQAAAGDLSDRLFFEANAETGTIEAQYPGRTGVGVDGGFGIRVRGRMGVAVAVSHAASSGVASVVAEVPHPFFDDRHRHVEGEAPDISRTETAVHLQLYYDLRPRGPWRAKLFAGPSYFNVEQELVTGVETVEAFPFDTASFGAARTTRVSGSAAGFNAGVDLSRMFGRQIGGGMMVRYARATVDLNAPGPRPVSTDSGGLQVGIGMRLVF